jgi:hypothetical protein
LFVPTLPADTHADEPGEYLATHTSVPDADCAVSVVGPKVTTVDEDITPVTMTSPDAVIPTAAVVRLDGETLGTGVVNAALVVNVVASVM